MALTRDWWITYCPKCFVLPLFIYILICLLTGRPTEIPEKDIYLNEARYDEEEGQFRKLKGLKVICPFVLRIMGVNSWS